VRRTLLGTLALVALALAGCKARAAEMRSIALDDEALAQASQTETGQWQTAPWADSLWLAFPGRTTLEIEHPLGRVPASVQVYLSFTGDDRESEHSRTAFPAAGDVAHITNVTDTHVSVANTTEADFHLRLVLE